VTNRLGPMRNARLRRVPVPRGAEKPGRSELRPDRARPKLASSRSPRDPRHRLKSQRRSRGLVDAEGEGDERHIFGGPLGGGLGNLATNLLEMELEGFSHEDREFEIGGAPCLTGASATAIAAGTRCTCTATRCPGRTKHPGASARVRRAPPDGSGACVRQAHQLVGELWPLGDRIAGERGRRIPRGPTSEQYVLSRPSIGECLWIDQLNKARARSEIATTAGLVSLRSTVIA
jgi:hypothetical protein